MRVTINIPDHILKEIKKYAKKHSKSVSAVTTEAVQKYMAACKKVEAGKIKIADNVYKELAEIRNEDRYGCGFLNQIFIAQ